jgi:hypothetical protein
MFGKKLFSSNRIAKKSTAIVKYSVGTRVPKSKKWDTEIEAILKHDRPLMQRNFY